MIVIPTPFSDSRLPMIAGCGGPCRCTAISEYGGDLVTEIELIRSTEEEKGQQVENVADYQSLRNTAEGLGYLQKTARGRANVFAALMEAVKSYSLGRISHAIYDVGGEYRSNM